jgi:hypothetical protein
MKKILRKTKQLGPRFRLSSPDQAGLNKSAAQSRCPSPQDIPIETCGPSKFLTLKQRAIAIFKFGLPVIGAISESAPLPGLKAVVSSLSEIIKGLDVSTFVITTAGTIKNKYSFQQADQNHNDIEDLLRSVEKLNSVLAPYQNPTSKCPEDLKRGLESLSW